MLFIDIQHTSIKIDQSGWAWLVSGRNLFIWRFMSAAGTKVCEKMNAI